MAILPCMARLYRYDIRQDIISAIHAINFYLETILLT